MMKSNATRLSGEEAKYSLDWAHRMRFTRPPHYSRPRLFMLVCSTRKNSNNGRV